VTVFFVTATVIVVFVTIHIVTTEIVTTTIVGATNRYRASGNLGIVRNHSYHGNMAVRVKKVNLNRSHLVELLTLEIVHELECTLSRPCSLPEPDSLHNYVDI